MNILVVDDSATMRMIVVKSLRQAGFDSATVIEAGGAKEALQKIAAGGIDLMLSDVNMPDITGIELVKVVKAKLPNLPVVMVTALEESHHRAAGVRVGANGYLSKPFTPAQLYEAMDKALAWHEEHQKRGTHGEINFDIRSELTYLQQAHDMLADLFAHTPLTDRQIKDLKQAVLEMGGNAIEWGHRKNADLVLRITYRIDPACITLIIQDQGPGFNPGNLPHAASDEDPIGHIDLRNELGIREGGFGIMLARGLVDDFWYNKQGNEVTLIKRFAESRTP